MSEDKKPDMNPNLVFELHNEKIEELIVKYAQERTVENLNNIVNTLHFCRILIPAEQTENKQPIPCLIKNTDGEKYLPVYTSKAEFEKSIKSQGVMNLGFQAAVQLAANPQMNAEGIVINPFSHNFIMKKELIARIAEVDKKYREMEKQKAAQAKEAKAAPKMKSVQLTAQQYVLLERKQFECNFLPKKFFTDGNAFVVNISDKKEEYIDELYEESYKEKRMYPYLAEEFPVMIMNISEEMMVIRVDMPTRDLEEGFCQRAYFGWNPSEEKGRYFMITKAGKESNLVEITSEMKPVNYGVAPVEGAELQEIINLMSNQGKLTS